MKLALDCIGIAGAAACLFGLWQAWQPAAFIAGGLGAMAAAWLLYRGGDQ